MMNNLEPLSPEALLARHCYCKEVRIWHLMRSQFSSFGYGYISPIYDGGQDDKGRVFKPVWETLARYIINVGASIPTFIRAQFHVPPPDRYPSVDDHMTQEAIWIFQQVNRELEEFIRESLQWELWGVQAEFALQGPADSSYSRRQVEISVLLDPVTRISPLLRYCLASRFGHRCIANCFKLQAMNQFSQCPDQYMAVWREWLPAELVAAEQQRRIAFQRELIRDAWTTTFRLDGGAGACNWAEYRPHCK